MNAQTTTRGKVYIASMNLRGKWATKLDPESMSLNVTSAQGKLNQDRLAFSPMTEIPGGYKGYDRFESCFLNAPFREHLTKYLCRADARHTAIGNPARYLKASPKIRSRLGGGLKRVPSGDTLRVKVRRSSMLHLMVTPSH